MTQVVINDKGYSDAELSRMAECEHRGRFTCKRVDRMLGWKSAYDLDKCDICWNLGPDTVLAASERQEHVTLTVERVKTHISEFGGAVRGAMVTRHLTEGEAEEYKGTEEARYLDGDPHAKPDLNKIDPSVRYTLVQEQWQKAAEWEREVKRSGILGQVWSYSMAKLSKKFKDVSLEVLDTRHVSCFGELADGTHIQDPCPSLQTGKKGPYCGDCGCGERDEAILDVKLLFPTLPCPRGRPGFSNSGGPDA